jgi:hypothetical protein
MFTIFTDLTKENSSVNHFLVSQASKRQPGTSGRLHRTVTGEWVWSSEEEGGLSSDDEVRCTYQSERLICLTCTVDRYLLIAFGCCGSLSFSTKVCQFGKGKIMFVHCSLLLQRNKNE